MAQFLLTHLVADVLIFGDKEAANQVPPVNAARPGRGDTNGNVL